MSGSAALQGPAVAQRATAGWPPLPPPRSPLTHRTAWQYSPEGNHMSVGGAQPLAWRCWRYCVADTGSFIQSMTCGPGIREGEAGVGGWVWLAAGGAGGGTDEKRGCAANSCPPASASRPQDGGSLGRGRTSLMVANHTFSWPRAYWMNWFIWAAGVQGWSRARRLLGRAQIKRLHKHKKPWPKVWPGGGGRKAAGPALTIAGGVHEPGRMDVDADGGAVAAARGAAALP
jgi:hypothetical protein